MNSCSLGVYAFRSSVQAAARRLAKQKKPNNCAFNASAAAPFSTHCLASWPSAQQQRQIPRRRGHARNAPLVTTLLGPAGPLPRPWLGVRTIIGSLGVITHYVDIPPNYKDEDGLPFARRDLETAEVVAIFGPHISTTAANKLLRILHGRRVAGTLEDPMLKINTMAFAAEHQKIALEYLRRKVPVDEITNAGLRAEDELAALEGDGVAVAQETQGAPAKASRLRLYKEAEEADKTEPAPAKRSVYGTSALDEIRARNKAKYEALLRQREEEKKQREAEERDGKAGPLQVRGQQQTRQVSAKMQEYMTRAQSDLKEPPKMTISQRLLPSALLVLGLTGLWIVYADLYKPAKREARMFPDIPPAAATVGALILSNLVVFCLWRIPPMWGLLNRSFLVVPATPNPFSMLNAVFSHQSFLHLVQNMAVLWFLGVRLHDEVGRGTFLATYFASGMVGAFGTLTWAVLRNRLDLTMLGASGAIYGVGAAYLWLHRFDSFKIFGLPPPPSEGFQGLTLLALAAAMNIAGIFTTKRLTVDLTSHLVGMGVGIIGAHIIERNKQAARQPATAKAAVPTKE